MAKGAWPSVAEALKNKVSECHSKKCGRQKCTSSEVWKMEGKVKKPKISKPVRKEEK